MSQLPPGSSAAKQLSRFFVGFAVVEGIALAAIILAMVFDVITTEQMIPAIIAVAVIGGMVMSWRMLSQAKQNQQGGSQNPQSGGPSHLAEEETASPGSSTSSGLAGLGDSDPMAKYRDPNR